jgi:hypothetical protein
MRVGTEVGAGGTVGAVVGAGVGLAQAANARISRTDNNMNRFNIFSSL